MPQRLEHAGASDPAATITTIGGPGPLGTGDAPAAKLRTLRTLGPYPFRPPRRTSRDEERRDPLDRRLNGPPGGARRRSLDTPLRRRQEPGTDPRVRRGDQT